jgi:hypothetical protein
VEKEKGKLNGKLKRSLQHLEREAKRLKDEQGRIARRNTRRNVLEALRDVRSALDEEYPVEKKERRPTKRRSAFKMPENFSEISKETKRFGQLIKAGIRIRVRKKETTISNIEWYYAPTWAVFAPPDTTIEQLKKARRSKTERDALTTLGVLWREQSLVQRRMRDDAKSVTYLMNYGADTEKIYTKMQEQRDERLERLGGKG